PATDARSASPRDSRLRSPRLPTHDRSPPRHLTRANDLVVGSPSGVPSREHEEIPMTRPIALEDLFRFRFVVAADLSPDATQVVFAQTRITPGENEDDDEAEQNDLHLLDVESGEIRRLTFSDSTNSAPAISPDGTKVAFTSSRSEKPHLWLLPLERAAPRQITDP